MPRVRLMLLSLLALMATGPMHAWLHGGNEYVTFEGVQLHASDCQHFPGAAIHADDCGLCVASRVAMDVPAARLDLIGVARCVTARVVDDPRVIWSWARRVHGARGPPRRV